MGKKRDIALLIVGFIGAMAGVFGVNMFNRYVLMSLPSAVRLVCMIVVYWLIALVPLVITACNKAKLSALGFSKDNLLAQVAVGIAIAAVMSVVFTLIPHLVGFGDWVDNGLRYKYLWQFIYEFVQCIIAVGAVEEFVFRGFFICKVKRRFRQRVGRCSYLIGDVWALPYFFRKCCSNIYDHVSRAVVVFAEIKNKTLFSVIANNCTRYI